MGCPSPEAVTPLQARPDPHTGHTHTLASISSGCSLPSRSVRSIRLVIAASRTLQGQGCGEQPRHHVTHQPFSGGSDTLNQSKFQRLTIASVTNTHQTQYGQPMSTFSRSASKDTQTPEERCHVPSARTAWHYHKTGTETSGQTCAEGN